MHSLDFVVIKVSCGNFSLYHFPPLESPPTELLNNESLTNFVAVYSILESSASLLYNKVTLYQQEANSLCHSLIKPVEDYILKVLSSLPVNYA